MGYKQYQAKVFGTATWCGAYVLCEAPVCKKKKKNIKWDNNS